MLFMFIAVFSALIKWLKGTGDDEGRFINQPHFKTAILYVGLGYIIREWAGLSKYRTDCHLTCAIFVGRY